MIKSKIKYLFFLFFLFSCAVKMREDEKPFYEHLQNNYQTYADYKYENSDYWGARRFYKKVKKIKNGYTVIPEKISGTTDMYNFFSKDVTYEQFYDMRNRMITLLEDDKAKRECPEELADLQFFYDCWTLEEGKYSKFSQPVRCKMNFIKSLEYLEIKLIKFSPEEIKAEEPVYEYKFPKKKKKYIIYFDFDSSALNNEGSLVLWGLMKDIGDLGNIDYTVTIMGHADRTGNKGYNNRLSRRRSNTIKHYLVSNGISDKRITINWDGELDPQIITKDEKKEQLNRRVEVIVNFEKDKKNLNVNN